MTSSTELPPPTNKIRTTIMAPTPTPILYHSPSTLPSKQVHHLRRQVLGFLHRPPGQPLASRREQSVPRDLNGTLQPTAVLESPPPPIPLMPSGSVALPPERSAVLAGGNQHQGPTQSGDVPGNIVVAVVVVVLILGGFIGLIIGGELLRRQTRVRGAGASSPRPRCVGGRKPKHLKEAVGSPQQRTRLRLEKFPQEEKTSMGLTCPPPALNRERRRKLSDVWPIRSLSRILYNRPPSPGLAHPSFQQTSPVTGCPQTTWSEFSPVTLYVPPPRMALDRIPEECEEDCESQTNGDNSVTARQAELLQNAILDDFKVSESSMRKGRHETHDDDCQLITRDEDCKSLGSSAPDMTSDGSGSSRSSTASLESLRDKNDGESLKEEAFELKRAQTRSMQMNKGVLLSLSLKTLDDSQKHESTHGELGCGPSGAPSVPCVAAQGSKDEESNLAMFGGTFSAISLNEFPSPPSILPMIPSFVSGF